ncbi:RDD family protein [Prevotella communis]|uniref:RDD family protein n=1 Tax=Prevotella communis TaxID=2913614 RepID=UPI001EDB835B|nr:RDD family protein [Prevotella communis]UKK59055.1 RDD family protein [Prevotella communis]
MAESAIITGQYVRLQPTVASVGDRILAQILDWIVLFAYVMLAIIIAADIIKTEWYYIITIGVIPLFYTLLMEIFNQGQSIGKMIMNMQVVKLDGSRPTLGSYLMRWLLFMIDGPMTSYMGLIVMVLTRNNQRLGDLAAGTVVIKKQKYKKIQISLDEYDYLSKGYVPRYPQATDLSLEQIDIITHTLSMQQSDFAERTAQLARKVCEKLTIERKETDDTAFLRRIVRDYQYYALEEI